MAVIDNPCRCTEIRTCDACRRFALFGVGSEQTAAYPEGSNEYREGMELMNYSIGGGRVDHLPEEGFEGSRYKLDQLWWETEGDPERYYRGWSRRWVGSAVHIAAPWILGVLVLWMYF